MLKVIYHDKCPDGFTSAWVAWRKFGDAAEYIPASYGQSPVETTEDDDVILVDFTYPRAAMDALPRRTLCVLDHHKTAQTDLAGLERATVDFDMERSGAGIAWDVLHGGRRPVLVDYIEDHDLWRYKLRASRAVRAYIHTYPYTFDDWTYLNDSLEVVLDKCIDSGNSVLCFITQQVKMICDKAYFGMLDDQLVPIVNATTLYSEVGEELNKRYPDHPFSAYWFRREDGKTHWGVRTKRADVDVSEVAKKYGGGGHRGAAGWVTDNGI